jgi:hypothetical protein
MVDVICKPIGVVGQLSTLIDAIDTDSGNYDDELP